MAENNSCTLQKTPGVFDYVPSLDTPNIVMVSISCFVVMVTFVIYMIEIVIILQRKETWPQPGKTLWLLGIYTVFGFSSLIGIIVPRSGDLGDMVGTMYLASALYIFKRLMINYFGGTQRALDRLEGSTFNPRGPPCCCCLCCLPMITVSSKSLSVMTGLVLQFTIIQPILTYTAAIILSDMRDGGSEELIIILNAVGSVSSMVALYGLIMFFRVAHQHLAYASITAKFVCLKLIVGISGLQKLLLTLLANTDVVPCSGLLNNLDNAMRMGRYMTVIEAFLIAILAVVYYQRDLDLHLKQEYVTQRQGSYEEIASLIYSSSSARLTESPQDSVPPSPSVITKAPLIGDGLFEPDKEDIVVVGYGAVEKRTSLF